MKPLLFILFVIFVLVMLTISLFDIKPPSIPLGSGEARGKLERSKDRADAYVTGQTFSINSKGEYRVRGK